MNTKLAISFERRGIINADMATLISAHNEGFNKVTISELIGILRGKRVESPNTLEDMKIDFNPNESKVDFYQDGKNLTFSITENEYYTLEDTDGKALEEQIAGEDALLNIELPDYMQKPEFGF
ncbi:MAG: hypothetical protein ABIP68_09655 [Ferruginibacter sp.]